MRALRRHEGVRCGQGSGQTSRWTSSTGSLTCLIGPNGAGKSTLLGCISGFHLVDEGAVRVDGRDVTRWPPHRRAQQGLATVFQTTRPLSELDVLDNAAVGAHVRSRSGFVESMLRPPWQWREQQRVREEAREPSRSSGSTAAPRIRRLSSRSGSSGSSRSRARSRSGRRCSCWTSRPPGCARERRRA